MICCLSKFKYMNLYICVETIRSNLLDVFFYFLVFLEFVLLLTQYDPVILVVILVTVTLEKIFEHVSHG